MAASPPPTPAGITRRTLLAASAAGLGLLLVGCTSADGGRAAVTPRQADALAGQVGIQESLMAAFAAAATADPVLGTEVADLAAQAQQQLDRLRAAAPDPSNSTSAGTTSPAPAPPAGPEARAWLRAQVAATADSHATACLDQVGARAALLGSIAAGLRGQDERLA